MLAWCEIFLTIVWISRPNHVKADLGLDVNVLNKQNKGNLLIWLR